MSDLSLAVIFSVFFIWIIILTFIVYQIRSHYRRLISRSKKGSIDEILDVLLEKDTDLSKKTEELGRELKSIVNNLRFKYQKLGFVRFNPFERIGGEQSFVVALLDGENNGILLNFLYTREGIRVYPKRLEKGKSLEHELSPEEEEAIKKAS